jgi:hypothetical protein
MTARARTFALLLLVAGATALLARLPLSGPLRVEIGAADGAFLRGPWSRAARLDLDPPAAADDVLSFYQRTLRPGCALALPLETSGPLGVALRAKARVRSSLTVHVARQPAAPLLIGTERWEIATAAAPSPGWRALELDFALRALPRARGDHGEPEVMLDRLDLDTAALRAEWRLALLLGALPLALGAFALALGVSPRSTLVLAAAGAVLGLIAWRAAPLVIASALPRLLPLALVTGALAAMLARLGGVGASDRRALAALVTAGTLLHALPVFLPNHNPPDLLTHVERTLDLRGLHFEYAALLRYGSHLPTASQSSAPATELFGSTALVPYSPLPYFFYYAAARMGLDLAWALTALTAALAMLAAVPLWLGARAAWDRQAAWLAAAFYALDLAVWHHVGRAHAPASFGQALATAALAFLVLRAEQLDTPRRILGAAALLALGVLGYTSLVILFGSFGVVLLALLALDARGLAPAARRGLALALAMGGLLALLLYYGHYVPGLLRGGGTQALEAEPEIYTGRVVLGLFRNEGRQSYRIWVLGFAWPLAAGLLAAPFALRRARPGTRPILLAWLAAWALVMLLKDPLFFPKTLRWAKEDHFVSPLLALLVAGGMGAWPAGRARRAVIVLLLLGAAALAARDFLFHANTL